MRGRSLLSTLVRGLLWALGLVAVGATSFFLTDLYLGKRAPRPVVVTRAGPIPTVRPSNLLPRSDDPARWPSGPQDGIKLGAAAADPFGGRRARTITFPFRDAGFFYGATGPVSPKSRKVTGSMQLRSPSGKATIGLILQGFGQEVDGVVCKLGEAWQTCSITMVLHTDAPQIQLGLDNRSFRLPGLDGSPGIVEVCCGLVEVEGTEGPPKS